MVDDGILDAYVDTVLLALHGTAWSASIGGEIGDCLYGSHLQDEGSSEEGEREMDWGPKSSTTIVPCISTTCQCMCAEQTMDQYFWILILFIQQYLFDSFYFGKLDLKVESYEAEEEGWQ